MNRRVIRLLLLSLCCAQLVGAEVMLQYFNMSWNDIIDKLPELSEAGYNSLWLPPPTKASGGLSVGYDLWDPFDLGGKDQRSTVKTRYGTEDDLLRLIEAAHRFGMRVYFDNIMNHRAFDVPGYNENTPITTYPGLLPEDFHLRVTEDGFYRKWDNVGDWNNTWEIQNRNFSDLIDIAQEPGTENKNFGTSEGYTHPKYSFVRDPDNPEYYCYTPDGVYVGFDSTNITKELISNNASYYSEYVQDYLNRAVRWLVDRTKVDGLRLDAVKHVQADFFGATYGEDKDYSDYGYTGQAQLQFNLTRGFSDPNHRDTVFNQYTAYNHGRDDLMMFGEHLGEPPLWQDYINAGMRLVDAKLHSFLNGNVGSPWGSMNDLQYSGGAGFDAQTAVPFVKSHDDDYSSYTEFQFAIILSRRGLPNVYSDGNYQSETLGESGGAFPRHANINYLGQFGDDRVPNMVYINNQFGRGSQESRWGDGDVVAYERLDKSDATDFNMNDEDAVVLSFMANDNMADGQYRDIGTSFPNGAYLWQYASGGGNFYHTVADGTISVTIPPGGYFAFSWRSPEESTAWSENVAAHHPVMLYENGQECGWMSYWRTDGPDGDENFNPYNVPAEDTRPYAYKWYVPRVTSSSNLDFVVRTDGSAENVLLKLDGGVDINSHMGLGPQTGDLRDHPPALASDTYLGFEQPQYQYRIREKFAAEDTARNIIGSVGAESYDMICGMSGITVNSGSGTDSDVDTPDWMYHSPTFTNDQGTLQVDPPPASAVNSNIDIWVKIGYAGETDQAYIYYTTDGATYPEGSHGEALSDTTSIVEMNWSHNDAAEPTIDWWKGTIPAQTNDTVIRYKIGGFKNTSSSVFPSGSYEVALKKAMLTEFAITNFNGGTAPYYPHNDYSIISTGLVEGFHLLTARPFLNHTAYGGGPAAAIYNTFVQPFYYDTKASEGDLLYPSENDTLYDNEYGCVLRTDANTKHVYIHIDDNDPTNDDGATGLNLGNGTNAAGQQAWADASETTPSLSITNTALPREWRFNYSNIPSNGTATITVKMAELSSSTNPLDSASSGHFGQITRTVNAEGPGYRMYVAWPQNNGDTVGEGYDMKVYFSAVLWDGYDQETVIDRFLITIDGEAQGRDQYQTSWGSGELAFTLPDLYDGVPGNIHEIVVTHTNAAGLGVNLSATREVYAYPTAQGAHIDIVQPPEYDSDGKAYEIVLPDVATPTADQRAFTISVETDTDAQHTWLSFAQSNVYTTINSIITNGNRINWEFLWTNISVAGSYRFYAYVNTNDATTNTISAQAVRNTSVIFREICTTNASYDWDDDGLFNDPEQTTTNLPSGNPEAWYNGDVHIWYAYGHTDPLRPDTDGDKLPDALEYGWTAADSSQTDTNADTNGDGYPNFLPDYDPPFYNTVPDNWGVPDYNLNDSRTKQIQGSVTDPGNADSDYDGIPDGIEDWNRNGWVDGDGLALPPGSNWWDIRTTDGDWPDGVINAWETWTETSPNVSDTDSDGASDGYGEDWDKNGWIAGDINSNRVWDPGELWTETDPLNPDTDGDGLPDGWEFTYNLSPWDCGILGYTNMQTGLIITNTEHGASGNPDEDIVVNGDVTNEYTNLMEYQAGTNPRQFNSQLPPPEGSIHIGRGDPIGSLTGISTQYVEFTDWSADDCRAVDEYEGQGKNNQGGDIYKYWDEWDSSRDLIAFYEHDGGSEGTYNFRVDLHDLKAYAEEGHLDIYIVIDTGNPAVGEMALPDEVDCTTSMKWEAVAAVYNAGNGILYVDTDRTHNTTEPYQNLADYGVVAKGPGDSHGFIDAYFNSELDSVEFSVKRAGLTDETQGAGWTGTTNLNFQVYTVSDGTCNSCSEGSAGAGDIGGRPDIRDAIYNDYIAEDHYDSQAGLPHVLMYWIPGDATINRAKFASVIHGNQAIQPGSVIQELLNDSQGGGYNRPLGSHELFATPLNLHITPTLASAIQWASIDPDAPDDWRKTKVADGPLFNQWIADLYATNIVYLFASSFSDHILPYFTDAFNDDNIALAQEYLNLIYGFTPTTNTIFWTPERVLDSDTFGRIERLGYDATCVDQMTHIWNWFGREAAIGSEGYRINNIEGIDCFVMNDGISEVRFENLDNGAALNLRNLLIRKALDDNTKDQIITMFSGWEDFSGDNANAYDRNLRWIANHQWILPLGLEQITSDRNFNGDTWWSVDRGTSLGLSKQAHNWLNHATKSNYDNWYVGADIYESLENKYFDIRSGTPLTNRFGMLYSHGLITQAWQQVSSVSNTNLTLLARSALHASVFETAFHDEDENNLARWSTGDYIYPPTVYSELAAFSKNAQAQARIAAVYARVDQWANSAATITATTNVAEDVDLDGEDEYLLYNDRIFGLFERIGGRLIAVWVREIIDGSVYQASGNLIGYAGSETEEEGTYNASTNTGELVIGSYRTSCLKDWWRDASYVNDYYTPSSISNGWSFMSSDVRIIKQITLPTKSWEFNVEYVLFPLNDGVPLYVRNGFSPNLRDLLINGQSTLTRTNIAAGTIDLANTNYATTVTVSIDYDTGSHSALLNTDAVDDDPGQGITFHTLNMRNQAQTQQIEIFGSNSFSFALGFRATPSDWNNNGMPNQWEDQYGLTTNALPGPDQDADGDGISNREEYIGNTDPTDRDDYFHVSQVSQTTPGAGITIRYPTAADRDYYIDYLDGSLVTQTWTNVDGPIQGTGIEQTWTDDGTVTPDPLQQDYRFYKIDVALPE